MRRIALASAGTLAVLAVTVVGVGLSTDSGAEPDRPSAVDTGFARDMIVHHQQAVLMASYTRQHAGSDQVRSLAGAIDSAQQREIGQMVGWLQSWGVPQQTDGPPMAWMRSDAVHHSHHHRGAAPMPGMATPAEMDELVNLTGRKLDVHFLRLMTRHHEGGLSMAKYAATRARLSYVRDAARSMISEQQREIDLMQSLP